MNPSYTKLNQRERERERTHWDWECEKSLGSRNECDRIESTKNTCSSNLMGFSNMHLQASPSTCSTGGARGIGLILISSVYEVDSIERPFQERCRAPRAEDMWPGCKQNLALNLFGSGGTLMNFTM